MRRVRAAPSLRPGRSPPGRSARFPAPRACAAGADPRRRSPRRSSRLSSVRFRVASVPPAAPLRSGRSESPTGRRSRLAALSRSGRRPPPAPRPGSAARCGGFPRPPPGSPDPLVSGRSRRRRASAMPSRLPRESAAGRSRREPAGRFGRSPAGRRSVREPPSRRSCREPAGGSPRRKPVERWSCRAPSDRSPCRESSARSPRRKPPGRRACADPDTCSPRREPPSRWSCRDSAGRRPDAGPAERPPRSESPRRSGDSLPGAPDSAAGGSARRRKLRGRSPLAPVIRPPRRAPDGHRAPSRVRPSSVCPAAAPGPTAPRWWRSRREHRFCAPRSAARAAPLRPVPPDPV